MGDKIRLQAIGRMGVSFCWEERFVDNMKGASEPSAFGQEMGF